LKKVSIYYAQTLAISDENKAGTNGSYLDQPSSAK